MIPRNVGTSWNFESWSDMAGANAELYSEREIAGLLAMPEYWLPDYWDSSVMNSFSLLTGCGDSSDFCWGLAFAEIIINNAVNPNNIVDIFTGKELLFCIGRPNWK